MNENKYTVSAPSAANVSAYYHIRELKFKKQKQYFSTFSSTSVKQANLCSGIPVLKKLNKSLSIKTWYTDTRSYNHQLERSIP